MASNENPASDDQARQMHNDILRSLTDSGRVIGSGWAVLVRHLLSADAPPQQVADLRFAYYAGAQHVYAALLAVLDPTDSDEPTDQEMGRMQAIHEELQEWARSEGAPRANRERDA